MKSRYESLSDSQWDKISELIPGSVKWRGRTGVNNRLFVNALIWIMRTGCPWRDLPEYFGNWNSIFRRDRRWCLSGHLERIFNELSELPNSGSLGIDGSIIKLHMDAKRGKKKGG